MSVVFRGLRRQVRDWPVTISCVHAHSYANFFTLLQMYTI